MATPQNYRNKAGLFALAAVGFGSVACGPKEQVHQPPAYVPPPGMTFPIELTKSKASQTAATYTWVMEQSNLVKVSMGAAQMASAGKSLTSRVTLDLKEDAEHKQVTATVSIERDEAMASTSAHIGLDPMPDASQLVSPVGDAMAKSQGDVVIAKGKGAFPSLVASFAP